MIKAYTFLFSIYFLLSIIQNYFVFIYCLYTIRKIKISDIHSPIFTRYLIIQLQLYLDFKREMSESFPGIGSRHADVQPDWSRELSIFRQELVG